MLRQFVLSAAVSACNIAIHALVMVAVVRVGQRAKTKDVARPERRAGSLHLIVVMIISVFVLMLAHFCEVLVWSVAYAAADVVPAGADPVYFAFVNYTTLGYGDIIPVKRWQLLGPMTAMNGWLLFGWSTAVIFEILRRTVRRISSGMALGDGSTVESARPAPIGM